MPWGHGEHGPGLPLSCCCRCWLIAILNLHYVRIILRCSIKDRCNRSRAGDWDWNWDWGTLNARVAFNYIRHSLNPVKVREPRLRFNYVYLRCPHFVWVSIFYDAIVERTPTRFLFSYNWLQFWTSAAFVAYSLDCLFIFSLNTYGETVKRLWPSFSSSSLSPYSI